MKRYVIDFYKKECGEWSKPQHYIFEGLGETEEEAKENSKYAYNENYFKVEDDRPYYFCEIANEYCEDVEYKKVFYFMAEDGSVDVNYYDDGFGGRASDDEIHMWSKVVCNTLEEAMIARMRTTFNTTPVVEAWEIKERDE